MLGYDQNNNRGSYTNDTRYGKIKKNKKRHGAILEVLLEGEPQREDTQRDIGKDSGLNAILAQRLGI